MLCVVKVTFCAWPVKQKQKMCGTCDAFCNVLCDLYRAVCRCTARHLRMLLPGCRGTTIAANVVPRAIGNVYKCWCLFLETPIMWFFYYFFLFIILSRLVPTNEARFVRRTVAICERGRIHVGYGCSPSMMLWGCPSRIRPFVFLRWPTYEYDWHAQQRTVCWQKKMTKDRTTFRDVASSRLALFAPLTVVFVVVVVVVVVTPAGRSVLGCLSKVGTFDNSARGREAIDQLLLYY